MRIVYIHNIAMPGPEANTVNVAKMCDAFAANGCDVTLAALAGAPVHQLDAAIRTHYGLNHPFHIVALPAVAKRPLAAAMVGAALARRWGADLVYTRAPHAVLAGCIAGIDSILEMHTPPDAFSSLGRAAYNQALRRPHFGGMVCISDALARRLRGDVSGGVPLVVAHDGADERPPPVARASGDRLAVGFVGRFYRGKGLELIAQIAPLCPWADFHVVGGTSESAERVIGAAPAANIIFHGAVLHAATARHMERWDVALAPYQRSVIVADGKTDAAAWMSPLKLFEYMAAGKAILASDLPVLREVVTDRETAMLLPPDDAAAWASALRALHDDPIRRAQLGARAYDVFSARYTWRERARQILQALNCSNTHSNAAHAA
jgi:glycosyltransferase involved in cell wall biosynthesis